MVSGITRNVRLLWRLIRDKRVPLALKMIVPGTLLYLILPADLVPDLLRGLGHLDDLAILLLGVILLLQLFPRPIIQQHLRERDHPGDVYIEPPYRIIEDEEKGQP